MVQNCRDRAPLAACPQGSSPCTPMATQRPCSCCLPVPSDLVLCPFPLLPTKAEPLVGSVPAGSLRGPCWFIDQPSAEAGSTFYTLTTTASCNCVVLLFSPPQVMISVRGAAPLHSLLCSPGEMCHSAASPRLRHPDKQPAFDFQHTLLWYPCYIAPLPLLPLLNLLLPNDTKCHRPPPPPHPLTPPPPDLRAWLYRFFVKVLLYF